MSEGKALTARAEHCSELIDTWLYLFSGRNETGILSMLIDVIEFDTNKILILRNKIKTVQLANSKDDELISSETELLEASSNKLIKSEVNKTI